MRTNEPIQISMKIPLPINVPDDNGAVYTKDALKDAYLNANNTPIVIMKDNKSCHTCVIGVTTNSDFLEDDNGKCYGLIEGVIWHGGTCEEVEFLNNKISSMSIHLVGFDD